MKVYLTSAYRVHNMLDKLTELATIDELGRHTLCHDAESADVILFVEDAQFHDYVYSALRKHALVKRYPDKVFMYNELDKPWCVLPGLYSSMPRRYFQHNRQQAFGFIHTPNDYVKDIYRPDDTDQRRWLFSFVGAMSHRCRKHIIALSDELPSVQDTSEFNVWHCTADTKAVQGKNYAAMMRDSRFVLCPRGLGTSSFRLFESMEAGRTPVIISNQWVPPSCVNWDFAVRIPEHDIRSIPAYLTTIADEAVDRGVQARREWEKTFAPGVRFDTMIEQVGELLETRRTSSTAYYLSSVRKHLIDSEVRLLGSARRMRDRLTTLASDFSV